MVETPGDRLRKLREAKPFETAKEAADAFGWNETTYRSHENTWRNIPLTAAKKYALAFGSTAAYILGDPELGQQRPVNNVSHVKLLARVSAGSFRYEDAIEEDAKPVPAVPRKDIPASAQYAVIVDGPSVNKRIPDGAYAICALYDSYPGGPQHGALVHVVRERAGLHEHTIKELRYTKTGMMLYPASTDPNHQEPIKLDSGDVDEVVRIQGVVIGIYQPV